MPRDKNAKVPEAYFEDVYVGKDPEDRDNLIHLSDTGEIDFGNGSLVISATSGISTTTADVTCVYLDASGNVSAGGGLLVEGGALLAGDEALTAAPCAVSINTDAATVTIGDASTTPGLLQLGDGAASATDVEITGGGGILLTTGGADIASTTPGTIVLGDATAIAGGLQLGDGATSATNAVLSGLTGYTSPFGAISLVQKTGVVQASTATYVLGATALTADAGGQDIVAGITNPDVPRNVTALANAAGCAGDVVVTGTNWAGEVITDTSALAGAAEVAGVKAFTTVTAVHLPPETHAGTDTVSIGVGNCLGLQRPIAAAGDVVEVARKASGAAEYTIEATGTVSAANGTVDQSVVGAIVNDDWFEITYNASAV